MNDFARGMQFGLKLAEELEASLRKSPAHFLYYHEWEGYKKGVTDYKKAIRDLLEAEV